MATELRLADLLLRLRATAETERRPGIVRQLELLAQQVLHRLDPGPATGSVDCLADLSARLVRQSQGKLISGGGIGSRTGRRDVQGDAIQQLTCLDAEILRRLGTWRTLQRYLQEHSVRLAVARQDEEEAALTPEDRTAIIANLQRRIDRLRREG